MQNFLKSKKILIALLVIIVAAAGIFIIIGKNEEEKSYKVQTAKAQNSVSKSVNSDNSQIQSSGRKLLKVSKSELYLGEKNAPVTIIEYASLSCPHCAAFYEKAYQKLYKKYIKTGKVKFVYRDFPLNQPALAGAVVAVCKSEEVEAENRAESYYNFIKALFKNQDSWAFDENFIKKLESIALLDGMSKIKFDECIDDKKLQEKILKARLAAAKSLNLRSTPTFFINNTKIEGFIDYKTLKKAIEKQLKN